MLGAVSLGKGEAWNTWHTYTTDAFEIKEANSGSITISIIGSLDCEADANKEEEIDLDNVTLSEVSYTFTELTALCGEADKLAEADYTADSWSELQTALTEAKALTEASDAAEITKAYVALQTAMDALVPLVTSTDVTFYYYAGETTDEIGLYYWGSNISTTAAKADWSAYTGDNAYLFTPVTGYTGWYSVPITISSGGAESGFEIFVSSDTGTPKVKYSASSSENAEVYEKLADGTNTTCAYKEEINYSGTDEATGLDKAAAIMRNVTFYAYIEENTPALQLDNNSAATKLTVVDEQTGEITEITASGTDAWSNPVWDMQKVTEDENWYSISFSVPGNIEFDGNKICGWYMKDSAGSYNWSKDIKNGEKLLEIISALRLFFPVMSITKMALSTRPWKKPKP